MTRKRSTKDSTDKPADGVVINVEDVAEEQAEDDKKIEQDFEADDDASTVDTAFFMKAKSAVLKGKSLDERLHALNEAMERLSRICQPPPEVAIQAANILEMLIRRGDTDLADEAVKWIAFFLPKRRKVPIDARQTMMKALQFALTNGDKSTRLQVIGACQMLLKDDELLPKEQEQVIDWFMEVANTESDVIRSLDGLTDEELVNAINAAFGAGLDTSIRRQQAKQFLQVLKSNAHQGIPAATEAAKAAAAGLGCTIS